MSPGEVRWLVMTHLHTDHAGGLHHFPKSEILVSRRELEIASRLMGRMRGYLNNRFPDWFSPRPIEFQREPFDSTLPVLTARTPSRTAPPHRGTGRI